MPSNEEIRSNIYFLWLQDKSPTRIYSETNKTYRRKVICKQTVFNWCNSFSAGRESIVDEQRSGRPTNVSTDDTVKRVDDLIQANRRVRIDQIADELNISHGTVHSIITNCFPKKVCFFRITRPHIPPKSLANYWKNSDGRWGNTLPILRTFLCAIFMFLVRWKTI